MMYKIMKQRIIMKRNIHHLMKKIKIARNLKLKMMFQTSNQSENNHSTSTDASTQTKEEPSQMDRNEQAQQIIKVQIPKNKNKGTRHYIQHEYVLFL